MLYLSGAVRPDLPAMITPRMRQRPAAGQVWAADNGRYASPADYSDAAYLEWLATMPASSCLFATAPDVVGDAISTLLMSAPMYRPIRRAGYRVALVAQDGLERVPELIPWHELDAIFIGGTTAWKLGPGARLIARLALERGRWLHMGRVNSQRRWNYAAELGCDSADGTVLRFGDRANRRRVDRWLATPVQLTGPWLP